MSTPTKSTIALVGTALMMVSFGFLIYFAEALLHYFEPATKAQVLADRPGSLPAVTPQIILLRNQMRGLDSGGRELVPFGGVSHTETIFCREAGEFISYRSDRYGFRNRDELWDQPTDIVAIGDSYTQGSCVEKHMVEVLRDEYPRTLNLGSFGNGPLANLGVLTEYALPQNPKTVLWFYVANDMSMDTLLESGSPVLRAYEHPGFSQRLRQRQDEIDGLLQPFLENETRQQAAEENPPSFFTLDLMQRELRKATMKYLRPPAPDFPAEFDYDRQARLDYTAHAIQIATAAGRARQSGAEFYFVIVPDARMMRRNVPDPYDPARHVERLQRSIEGMGVPTINLYELLRNQEQPERYYAPLAGYYGHFNESGYRLVGNHILKHLTARRSQVAKRP